MSSLSAKARFAKIGGLKGTVVVTPPPGESPPDSSPPVVLTVVDTTTARTAAVTDNNKIIEFTNVAAIAYTIKAYDEVPLPVGAILIAQQGDTGQVTFVPDAGVTFESSDSYKTRARESFIAMKHTSLNQWKALGDLEASIAALSVLGRAVNSAGGASAITATADLQVLMRRASTLVFDLIGMSDITGLVAALALKAPLASPTFTGVPAAPTAAPGTNTTQLSTTAFVQAAIAALVAASPATLDTLNELATALANDPNFATTMTNALALKASIAQVQQGALLFVAAGGTADALTATLAPVPTLADGMQIHVRAGAANATTTPTLAVNGGTARTITKLGGVALAVGDISGAGHELIFRYVSSVPRWELINPAVITLGGGTIIGMTGVKKTASTSRSNTVTLADDPHLSVTLAGATAYYLRVFVPFTTANAAMDFKYRLNYTGTITAQSCTRYQQLAGVVFGTDNQNTFTSNSVVNSTISMTATSSGDGVLIVDIAILTGTGGTFSVQWAQDTSDAGNCTVYAGASILML